VDAQTLLMLWQQMRYQGDQEAGLEAEEERRRNRWLQLWQTWKERLSAMALFPPKRWRSGRVLVARLSTAHGSLSKNR
jgi:hypothetical protein